MWTQEQLLSYQTAEISDALDSLQIEGAIQGLKPLLPGTRIAGPVFTVRYAAYEKSPETFQGAGDYIDDVPPGSIVLIDNQGRSDCTVWGDILTQVACAQGLAGTVVYGAVRDVADIRSQHYPVFSKHVFMRSGKNRVFKLEQQMTLRIENVSIAPGDYLFADDSGVVIVPRVHLKMVLERAAQIQVTELRIQAACATGMRLCEARRRYRYAQPWQG